jgi:hypothetical protein
LDTFAGGGKLARNRCIVSTHAAAAAASAMTPKSTMATLTSWKEKGDDNSDVEAQLLEQRQQLQPPPSPQVASEYQVSSATKLSYLALYFVCNISLTIYNKLILGKVGVPLRTAAFTVELGEGANWRS